MHSHNKFVLVLLLQNSLQISVSRYARTIRSTIIQRSQVSPSFWTTSFKTCLIWTFLLDIQLIQPWLSDPAGASQVRILASPSGPVGPQWCSGQSLVRRDIPETFCHPGDILLLPSEYFKRYFFFFMTMQQVIKNVSSDSNKVTIDGNNVTRYDNNINKWR